MKVLALHLPQFHTIPENDEWWGEGFTEWTNIKKHNRYSNKLKPLDDNYYNLLDKETMIWQNKLAAENGIEGFCYYHYYFKGKKLLEKPAENLLKWKDITQKFCFQWANHTWKRSWQGKQDILIKQEYGEMPDWLEHFRYLEKFFVDERYIKIDNKPLFIIFDNKFECKAQMMQLFDAECKKIGFNGVYFVENIGSKLDMKHVISNSNAILLREPAFSHHTDFFTRVAKKMCNSLFKVPRKYKAWTIMKTQIKNLENKKFDKQVFLGAFAMWDNTYRHNSRGYKITPPSEAQFVEYLQKLKEYGEVNNVPFLLFNAWNEWAEGMILEPSNLYGLAYLECIREVFGSFDNYE